MSIHASEDSWITRFTKKCWAFATRPQNQPQASKGSHLGLERVIPSDMSRWIQERTDPVACASPMRLIQGPLRGRHRARICRPTWHRPNQTPRKERTHVDLFASGRPPFNLEQVKRNLDCTGRYLTPHSCLAATSGIESWQVTCAQRSFASMKVK
jgi:hypothetical protein